MNKSGMHSSALLLCGLALTLGGFAVSAFAQLTIDWYTIDGGGHTFSTGDTYSLGGTCGQPDAGTLGAGGLQLNGGFWLGGTPASGIPDWPEDYEDEQPDMPVAFRVIAPLCNPFNVETGIQLDLPISRPVEVRVFDYSGRYVTTLHEGTMPAGRHRLTWNAVDRDGRRVASGVYLLQVRAGDSVTRRRVVYLR